MKLAPATPKGYRRLIPSVTALVEFEAVARLGSFTLAAQELGVTQAAVSRQIKFLEDLLGTRLFHRLHRSIALTGEGAVTQFRTQQLVIAGEGESQPMSTKLFGNLQWRDLGDLHLWTHNSWTHVMSDHAVVSYVIPLAADRTLVRTKRLVHADAVEGVDYQLPDLTAVWVATNTQDPAYSPSTFSPFTEAYADQFSRGYAVRLNAHGI